MKSKSEILQRENTSFGETIYSMEKTLNYLLESLEYEINWLKNGRKKDKVCRTYKYLTKIYRDTRIKDLTYQGKISDKPEINTSVPRDIWKIGNSYSWEQIWRYYTRLAPPNVIIRDGWCYPTVGIWAVKKMLYRNFLNANNWLDIEIVGRAFENTCRIFCLLLHSHNRYLAVMDSHSDSFQYCPKSISYALKRLELINRDELDEIFPNSSNLTRDDFSQEDIPF